MILHIGYFDGVGKPDSCVPSSCIARLVYALLGVRRDFGGDRGGVLPRFRRPYDVARCDGEFIELEP